MLDNINLQVKEGEYIAIVGNITLPTELDGREVDGSWLSEILKTVGLDGREQAYPSTLSGGQQQRVAIARGKKSYHDFRRSDRER